jgi:hypothetical protein
MNQLLEKLEFLGKSSHEKKICGENVMVDLRYISLPVCGD